jgi:predicted secreted protein
MDIVSGVVVYVLLWWWVLFMVLPFGAKAPEQVEEGHATSAPAKPRMMLKLIITTALSAILFIFVYLIIASDIFSFRDLAG